jgi:hypothetical protein
MIIDHLFYELKSILINSAVATNRLGYDIQVVKRGGL